MISLNNSRIRVLALKKAEQSDEIVVRFVEMDGRPARGVRVTFAAPVLAAREITGTEMPIGPASIAEGELLTDFSPFEVRSFALKIAAPAEKIAPPKYKTLELPYDVNVASRNKAKATGGFDAAGRSLPTEMLPAEIPYAGIVFRLASPDKQNAVVCRGQSINLPVTFNRVYILAAAADGDQKAEFRVGGRIVDLTIQDWGGYVGQWDNRKWNIRQEPVPAPSPRPGQPTPTTPVKPRMRTVMEYLGVTPGFVKPASVAWFASHRHTASGANEAYAYCYLFAYVLDSPSDAAALTLPKNEKIRVLAVTVADEPGHVRPVQNLVDAPLRK